MARVVYVGLLQWLLLVLKQWFVATMYTSAFGLLLLGKNCHAERNTETLKIPSLWLCFTELLLITCVGVWLNPIAVFDYTI